MKKLALVASVLLTTGLSTAYAEDVNWLHITPESEELDIMTAAAREYEALNPGITIKMQFLENEAFKAKLTTLLQSNDAPDIFYSWGGGVLSEQAEAGVLMDASALVDDDTRTNIGSAGIDAFTREGKLYGLAQHVSQVTIWMNLPLLAEAGVDTTSMGTWDGFLAGVQKVKDAGITPLAMGGKDKWPAMFYWAHLVVRVAGQEAYEAAVRGEGEGFAGEPFVKAGEYLEQLAAIEPFQQGYMAATWPDAAGVFGDGKAAMFLMGDWVYGSQATNSASGEGLSDDELGIIPFPAIDGAGDPTDTLGGIQGWLFGKNASPEDVKFLEWYLSKPVMSRFAEAGYFIPIVDGAAAASTNKFKQEVGANISGANWHALFFDQFLSKAAGLTVNDIAIEIAAGELSAEEGAEILKEAVDDSL
jgi:raffinose/stachyose/melibiose transport system substrate-binding protein